MVEASGRPLSCPMDNTPSTTHGWKLLIAAAAAAGLLAAAGCRDDSAQPETPPGQTDVELDLEPEEPAEAASPEGFDPGAQQAEAPEGEPAQLDPEAEGEPEAEAGEGAEGEEVVNRQELESGLIIEDLVIGEGAAAPEGATVTIHYEGTLTDGTVFDSSYDRGEPATFPLGRLIQGWQEGIPGMREGGKRRLRIPYQLGYGERGSPPTIPPRSDLVFVIELIEVQ